MTEKNKIKAVTIFKVFIGISLIGIILITTTIIGTLYGLSIYIDNRITKIVSSREFSDKLAREVRPYIIFDINGSILFDGGGMQYLEDVTIEPVQESSDTGKYPHYAKRIIVSPRENLSYPPIVTALTMHYFIKPSMKRGKKYQWIYECVPLIIPKDGSIAYEGTLQFRLEIVK